LKSQVAQAGQLPIFLTEIACPDLRILQQTLAGIGQNNAAGFDHVSAARNLEGELRVLLDQKNGDSVGTKMLDRLDDFFDDYGCQPQRWFVKQQQDGLRHHRAAKGQHLLFASAQRASELSPPLVETRKSCEDPLACGPFSSVSSGGVGSRAQILMDREPRKYTATFRHLDDAELDDVLGREPGDWDAQKFDYPRGGPNQTGNRLQER
jgi:hypothetical protein